MHGSKNKLDSVTVNLCELELAEMIDDEILTARLEPGFDPWPGRWPLEPLEFETQSGTSGDWLIETAPVRLGVKND